MNFIYKPLLLVALAMFLAAASLPAAADTTAPPVQPSSAPSAPAAHPGTQTAAEHAEAIQQRWYLSGLIVILLGVGMVYRLKFRRQLI
jgi:hypothetical protein